MHVSLFLQRTGAARVVLVSLVVGLTLASCGSDRAGGAGRGPSGEVTVAAASSLTDAFTRIGRDYEAAHPGRRVTFTFDSSANLAEQILDGAPVDVFASADLASMARLTSGDRVSGRPAVIVRNRLAIVAEPGNPKGISSLADLVGIGVVSLCGAEAPCGKITARVLRDAGVEIPERDITRGQNVRATLNAVTEGDAIAGVVYATDALAAGDRAETVVLPVVADAVADYPIAVLRRAGNGAAADAFVAYVSSGPGRAVLKEFGFLPPA